MATVLINTNTGDATLGVISNNLIALRFCETNIAKSEYFDLVAKSNMLL